MKLELAPPAHSASSNLAAALFLLPAARRQDALAFYRFCRAVDDIADSLTLPLQAKLAQLELWHHAVETGGGLPEELAAVLARYAIPSRLPLAIIEGCMEDVTLRDLPNWEALESYCWKVAGAVGEACLPIFGARHPASVTFAQRLGLALQLTNILRDTAEDTARGRLYYPRDLLESCGCSPEEILSGRPGPGFRRAARRLAAIAQSVFSQAKPPREDAKALRPALLMAAIYRCLLRQMERAQYEVLERRWRVPRAVKLALAVRVWLWPLALSR